MKAIMLMFDSLSRRMLPPYTDMDMITPNFQRLSEKAVTFDNFFVGSLPCMPVRRELHTGRYNFLHRTWGPIEPFDVSMPELLKKSGVYTHLVSDHIHYWDDGGSTYHKRYNTWECCRGQAADSWVGKVAAPEIPEHVPTMREYTHPIWWKDYWNNHNKIEKEGCYPQIATFNGGMEFLENNADQDNWFLQIETFDPHEPFDMPDEFRHLYEKDGDYTGDFFNSPSYGVVMEDQAVVDHGQALYKSLITMCDRSLGRVLDFMDAHNMWDDTMLILNADHGLMVGEKDWWAKSVMPCYNEISNLPFYIWDPRNKATGRRQSLAQTIDIPPTLLDFFGLPIPTEMQGKPLTPVVENDTPIRDVGLFGYHGSFINMVDNDGHVYMRASQTIENKPSFEYTLMPTTRSGLMGAKRLAQAELVEPFGFTKGLKTLKIPAETKMGAPIFCNSFQYGHLLWDLNTDSDQLYPVDDPTKEADMMNKLLQAMEDSDAPAEQYVRVGLERGKTYTAQDVQEMRTAQNTVEKGLLSGAIWEQEAITLFIALAGMMSDDQIQSGKQFLKTQSKDTGVITCPMVEALIHQKYVANPQQARYFITKLKRTL
ncbi:sulfatase [Bengtsoniella intestinalis]|uniref:sulfatase n=1 Tax=Bengtsoniella intestinalis TaxID=3073143 RepID=UPI00391F9055